MTANVRTFRAETPRAALAAVKAALGPEAVILATRELKGTLLTRGGVEVLAAPPAPAEPEKKLSPDADPAGVEPLGVDEKTEVMTRSDATRAMMARRSRAAFGRRTKRRKNEALFGSSDELADAYADNPFSAPTLGARLDNRAGAMLSPPDGNLVFGGTPRGQAELGDAPFEASFFAPPMGLDEAYGGLSDLDEEALGRVPEDDISDEAMEALAVALGVPLPTSPSSGVASESQVSPTLAADAARGAPAIATSPSPSVPPAAGPVLRRLVERGVSEALAGQLIEAAIAGHERCTPEQLMIRVGRRLREHVTVARAPWSPDATGQRDVVALIGPTGVGKTTTIAKIAARAIMEFSLKVALITVDTYRIGAAHQLARYGELLGAPTFVARDRSGLSQAMERSRHADLVLIDTAGRSNAADVASQASLIQSVADVQMHLAVSATSSRRHLARVKQRFAVADTERVIVTKLDEGDGPASFIDPVLRLGLPLSCVTIGQRVPEDIEALSPASIVDRVVGA
jgi:flagellar biosynthesis GTPase FlhF